MCNIKMFKVKSNLDTLIGTHHVGDNSKDYCVMIVHGYLSANRIGPYRMYYQIADMLNKYGYDVFRIDFAGCGESTDNQEITLETFYQNFIDSLKYIKKKVNKKIILIGHCLGANLAIYYNGLNLGDIHLSFAISPLPITEISSTKVFTSEQVDKASKNESFERKGLVIHPSFLGGFSKGEILKQSIENKSDNLTIYIPENDAYIDLNETIDLFKNSKGKTMVVEKGDHHFLNKECRSIFYKDMLETILLKDFNYKHIIFDIDGTLDNSESVFGKVIANAYYRLTNTLIDESVGRKMFGLSAIEICDALKIENEKRVLFGKYLAEEFSKCGPLLFDGIKEIIERLYNKNVTLGIITSRSKGLLNQFLIDNNLEKFFTIKIAVDDVKKGKPYRDSIEKYVSLTNANLKDILYIGDKYNDYLFAANSSVDFAYALWGVKADERVDLNKCKFVFYKVSELGDIVC